MLADEGKLALDNDINNKVVLTAFSDKGFFIPNSVSYVEFERDAEGAVTQVTLHGVGEPVAHARIGALAQ